MGIRCSRLFTSELIDSSGRFESDFSVQQIKNEKMFFSSSVDYAFDLGGPITRAFIKSLPVSFLADDAVFDSRVHMLMPGWYPCIPGWHHDDVPRGDDGQPDYNHHGDAEHVLGLVGADIAPTEFLHGNIFLPPYWNGQEPLYSEWHRIIEREVEFRGSSGCDDDDAIRIEKAESGVLYRFGWSLLHRGTAAVKSGWRWFGRVSVRSTRKQTNEIRNQVQVYLPETNRGW